MNPRGARTGGVFDVVLDATDLCEAPLRRDGLPGARVARCAGARCSAGRGLADPTETTHRP